MSKKGKKQIGKRVTKKCCSLKKSKFKLMYISTVTGLRRIKQNARDLVIAFEDPMLEKGLKAEAFTTTESILINQNEVLPQHNKANAKNLSLVQSSLDLLEPSGLSCDAGDCPQDETLISALPLPNDSTFGLQHFFPQSVTTFSTSTDTALPPSYIKENEKSLSSANANDAIINIAAISKQTDNNQPDNELRISPLEFSTAFDRLITSLTSSLRGIENAIQSLSSEVQSINKHLQELQTEDKGILRVCSDVPSHHPSFQRPSRDILRNVSDHSSVAPYSTTTPAHSEDLVEGKPSKLVTNRGTLVSPPVPLHKANKNFDSSYYQQQQPPPPPPASRPNMPFVDTIPPISEDIQRQKQAEEARRIEAERKRVVEQQHRRVQLEHRAKALMSSIISETPSIKKGTLFEEVDDVNPPTSIGSQRNPLFD